MTLIKSVLNNSHNIDLKRIMLCPLCVHRCRTINVLWECLSVINSDMSVLLFDNLHIDWVEHDLVEINVVRIEQRLSKREAGLPRGGSKQFRGRLSEWEKQQYWAYIGHYINYQN